MMELTSVLCGTAGSVSLHAASGLCHVSTTSPRALWGSSGRGKNSCFLSLDVEDFSFQSFSAAACAIEVVPPAW